MVVIMRVITVHDTVCSNVSKTAPYAEVCVSLSSAANCVNISGEIILFGIFQVVLGMEFGK